MGSLFLFISLAVLVGIVGLLAYYFKSRLAEVESKNLKSKKAMMKKRKVTTMKRKVTRNLK